MPPSAVFLFTLTLTLYIVSSHMKTRLMVPRDSMGNYLTPGGLNDGKWTSRVFTAIQWALLLIIGTTATCLVVLANSAELRNSSFAFVCSQMMRGPHLLQTRCDTVAPAQGVVLELGPGYAIAPPSLARKSSRALLQARCQLSVLGEQPLDHRMDWRGAEQELRGIPGGRASTNQFQPFDCQVATDCC